ncbi:hypothetical protein [Thermofilum sp.]|uniref:hypothetical protein n=1 Tax=Thermofilum sp. TaxID=1961369 RepID=UPI0031762CCE
MSSAEEKLANFLKSGQDWSRVRTAIPGVFVIRMPAYKNSPARLAVEINPVDSAGNPVKKRGLIIRSMQELEEFKNVLGNEKLPVLIRSMEKVNPKPKSNGEVVEI